jgi:hypothetical protein
MRRSYFNFSTRNRALSKITTEIDTLFHDCFKTMQVINEARQSIFEDSSFEYSTKQQLIRRVSSRINEQKLLYDVAYEEKEKLLATLKEKSSFFKETWVISKSLKLLKESVLKKIVATHKAKPHNILLDIELQNMDVPLLNNTSDYRKKGLKSINAKGVTAMILALNHNSRSSLESSSKLDMLSINSLDDKSYVNSLYKICIIIFLACALVIAFTTH